MINLHDAIDKYGIFYEYNGNNARKYSIKFKYKNWMGSSITSRIYIDSDGDMVVQGIDAMAGDDEEGVDALITSLYILKLIKFHNYTFDEIYNGTFVES